MSFEIEKEMKFLISESDYKIMLSYANRTLTQINHYFDTPNFFYLKHETTVRIRYKSNKYEFTIKQKIKDGKNGRVSKEYNEKISEFNVKEFLQNGIDLSAYSNYVTTNEGNPFVIYMKSLTTLRSEISLGDNILQLDKNQYLGVTDYEMEYEYNSTDELQTLKNFIKKNKINILPSASKNKRFFNALRSSLPS